MDCISMVKTLLECTIGVRPSHEKLLNKIPLNIFVLENKNKFIKVEKCTCKQNILCGPTRLHEHDAKKTKKQ